MIRWPGAIIIAVASSSVGILAPSASAEAPAVVCMKAARRGPETNNKPFVIMVAQSAEAAMLGRGFVTTPCGGRDSNLARYRDSICRFASRTPPPVQAKFAEKIGASPAELCSKAPSQ
jgi:hypothetical protein